MYKQSSVHNIIFNYITKNTNEKQKYYNVYCEIIKIFETINKLLRFKNYGVFSLA